MTVIDSGYAFFDVDDTLISIKSMFSFQDYWYQRQQDRQGHQRFYAEMDALRASDTSWEVMNRQYYRYFRGRSVAAVAHCGRDWFAALERTVPDLFHRPIIGHLRDHQSAGREIVFVSGSFPALLQPVADRLGVSQILAIQMVDEDGIYTGAIRTPQTIGEGKAEAIRQFLDRVGYPASQCYGYGDDISDLPMLQAVGFPHAVAGGRGLVAVAAARGWPILSPV